MSWIGNPGEMEGNVMSNESAYERRRREASEVIAKHEYAGQMTEVPDFVEPMAVKSTPSKYKEMGITSMLNAVHSALSVLEDNFARLNESLTPVLTENVPNMESSDPRPPLESGMAQELWAIMRRVQTLDNFVAQVKHRVDL